MTVGDDVSEPGPCLEANPEAISWNIAPGDDDPLSVNLDVRNSGGGTLRWRTTGEVPWLTLSATGGEGDQRLTLHAAGKRSVWVPSIFQL